QRRSARLALGLALDLDVEVQRFVDLRRRNARIIRGRRSVSIGVDFIIGIGLRERLPAHPEQNGERKDFEITVHRCFPSYCQDTHVSPKLLRNLVAGLAGGSAARGTSNATNDSLCWLANNSRVGTTAHGYSRQYARIGVNTSVRDVY